MSWYREGTINVTKGSVEVIGVGTAFKSEVRFSDILLVDGSLYEVSRVESDTKLKLTTPFVGESIGDSAYAIIRNLTNASNFDLMKKIEEFLTDRQRSMDEFVEWINGLPNSGPTADGVFPLTDRYGVTVYCKSPKQMEADTLALTNRQAELIEETETTLSSAESRLAALGDQQAWADQILGYKNAAAASATLAQQWADNNENVAVTAGKFSSKHHATKAAASATASANSATAASASATNASGSATAASTSATNAASSATAAGTSATNAANSATAAASSATAAQTSASQAATSKTGADTAKAGADASKTAAGVSETNAAASATAAATSASAASSSANTAKDWAEKTTGAVTGTQYSAKYHAQLAQTARADVETRQNDVMARQTDVTAKYNSVVTLEASALASKNAAATSATTAATKATEASNSATAASTSATNAAASATTATTKASEASTSASNAAASATAADNSATAASASKTGAEAAKTAAEAARAGAEAAQTGADAAKTAAEEARDRAELAASTLTGNLVEFGGIDLSGNAYPVAPATAGFWKVTAAGVVDGIEYGVGDTLVYSKNLSQFYKIDNTESVTSVNGKTGTVTLSAADVGALPTTGTAVAATKLATTRTISTTGDATGSASFDGTANAAITLTLANSGVVAGTYPKVTVDAKGRVTAGAPLLAADIPTLNQNTTGNAGTATKLATARNINGVPFDGTTDITVVDSTKLPLTGGSMVGSIVFKNIGAGGWARGIEGRVESTGALAAGLGVLGSSDSISTAYLGMGASPWSSGNGIRVNASGVTIEGAATFVGVIAGNGSGLTGLNAANLATGIIPDARISGTYTGVNITGNAATATKLAAARTLSFTGDAVGSGSFDGSGNISIALIYKDSGVTPGTYTKVTVDQKGNVTGGTTLSAADIPTLNQSTTGNAGTATKLATARTVAVSGAVVGSVSFDGSANASIVTSSPRFSFTADPTTTFRASVFGANANMVKVLRTNTAGFANFDQYAPGLAWSTDDTHAFISPSYNTPKVVVGAGSGAGLAWSKELAFTDSDITGNASTATKLATARSISLTGDVTGSVAFDGSGNVSIASTVANDSHTHDTRYPVLSAERVLTGVAAGSWVTIAQVPSQGGRAYGEFIVYDTDSSKHNVVKIVASHAYGQSVVACVGGNRFGTRTIAHVRVLHGTVDRTYDGAKLQVYIESTCALRVRALMINQISGWSGWSEMTPVVEGTPAGWAEDTTTRYDDITNTATGFSGSFSGNGSLLTKLNAAQLTGTVPDAVLPASITSSITGNAATATKLATARTINGVAFDGTANISITDPTSIAKAGDTITGKIAVGSTTSRSAGMYGTYDSAKIAHVWSMGTAYAIPDDGSTFGTLYGMAYKHTNNTTGGTMAGGHQIVFCTNGAPGSAIGLSGGIWTSGNVSAYSDIRVKTNIEVIPHALAKVMQLRGVTYDRIDRDGERQTGVIAQEVQKVLPEAVSGDDMLSVAYGNMVGLLIEAIKELNAKIDSLQEEVIELRRVA